MIFFLVIFSLFQIVQPENVKITVEVYPELESAPNFDLRFGNASRRELIEIRMSNDTWTPREAFEVERTLDKFYLYKAFSDEEVMFRWSEEMGTQEAEVQWFELFATYSTGLIDYLKFCPKDSSIWWATMWNPYVKCQHNTTNCAQSSECPSIEYNCERIHWWGAPNVQVPCSYDRKQCECVKKTS